MTVFFWKNDEYYQISPINHTYCRGVAWYSSIIVVCRYGGYTKIRENYAYRTPSQVINAPNSKALYGIDSDFVA